MRNLEKLHRILNASKRYEMNGSVLTLTHYYTGEEIKLDLSKLDEEVLEEIMVEEEEEDVY